MKGRTTKLSGAADAAETATATAPHSSCGRSSSESNEDSFPVISSANQQTEPGSSPENATSEAASTVQILPPQETSTIAQPSTPRTPSTPPEHGTNIPNPPTPGNTTSGNLVNTPPNYVTVSEGTNNSRSYASLTPVNPAGVDTDPVNEEVGDSAYVTYVEGTADHNSLYAAAAAAAAAATTNGQTLPYPVYTVGDNGMYNTNPSQYYTANAANPAITYAQENGVTYLVSPTNNNTNASSTNSNLEIEGQPNLSHATRVSPATDKNLHRKRKVGMFENQWFEDSDEEGVDEETDEEAEREEFILSGLNPGFGGDSVLLICKTDINRLFEDNLSVFAAPGALGTLQSCPLTVQWLMDNYETAEGVSLPRSTLYNHYIRHCTEHKLDPVNAASFGKLIRSVFLGLRTRRLGTRGNSKYHYYGIRLKPDSILNHFVETPSHHSNGGNNRHNSIGMNSGHMAKRQKTSKSEHYEASQHINGISLGEAIAIQQYLGDSSRALEDFPNLDFTIDLPDGIGQDDIIIFHSVYREHCEALLEDVVNFQLSEVDRRWRIFWRTGDISPNNVEVSEFETVLPYAKLHTICRMKEIQQFVRDSDYRFYQNIVGILMPDVLRPIPSSMTQAIRNFAKTLEGCLAGAMSGYPEEMVTLKLNIVNALAQTLRRYTSLNHLAQAARAVLQNQTQINQMLSDLNRVDFHNVEEQASWVCGCDGDLVPDLEADFKATLGQQQTLEQWATWLEGVVDRILRPHLNSPKFVQAARHFILKWSFYSSLVIRDLTLRSAASFGSFHLLRLLYDEYMFFLVEHRVAQVTGIVPIAVIGKKSFDGVSFDPSMDSADEEDAQTEAVVTRYLNEHHHSPNVSHTQSVVNGINGNVASMLPSTTETLEASPIPVNSNDLGSPSQHIIKSEFKQRVKNFLTV